MRLVLFLTLIMFSSVVMAKKGKIKYEYKKFERFDFEALDVKGNKGSPGELSIPTRLKSKYKNKLPGRKNFNREMKRAIDTVI